MLTNARVHRILNRALPYLLLLPAGAVILPLLIYPLFRNLILSFYSYEVLFPQFDYVGLGNYRDLFNREMFLISIRVTLVYTFFAVLFKFVIGMGLALLLNLDIYFRRFLRLFAMIPYLTAPALVALIWRLFWDPDLGPINSVLLVMGVQGPAWIAQKSTALFSVIYTTVWRDMPFVALVFLAGLQSLPEDPYDAAKVDGCTAWQTFWHITIPMLKPIIMIIVLFQTIFTLRIFDIIYVLTGGGPGAATQTFSILIYTTLLRMWQGGAAAATSVILLSITTALSLVFFRVLYREMDV